jgi:hypothetical protein
MEIAGAVVVDYGHNPSALSDQALGQFPHGGGLPSTRRPAIAAIAT